MKAPGFWQDSRSPASLLLAPFGWVYAEATAWRLAHARPWRAPMPVICVGNLTAGGSGKTPVVRDLAGRLRRAGRKPCILSRGYGGSARGPLLVDPACHGFRDVGDEPLLLARNAPCLVAADRMLGAQAIAATDADLILMDDGLQNPALVQDLRLVVVDGEAGFGNGRAMPAGPLRERIDAGLSRADALALIGPDRHGVAALANGHLPILRAWLEPSGGAWIAGMTVFGFAGIGRPEKFRATLDKAGAKVAGFRPFADHHPYTERELAQLGAEAEALGATLVTTEKDWVRLSEPWRSRVRTVEIELRWENEAALTALLDRAAHG